MARCMGCNKSLFRCRCHSGGGTPEKEQVKVKGKDGRTRSVTRNTGNTVNGGVTWCGRCSCRVLNGRCTNVTCSSHR